MSVKNALIDPVTLTFDLSTPNPCHWIYLIYLNVIPYIPSLRTLGSSFVFSYAADKQTKTDGFENPTYADRQSRHG